MTGFDAPLKHLLVYGNAPCVIDNGLFVDGLLVKFKNFRAKYSEVDFLMEYLRTYLIRSTIGDDS